MSASNCPRCGAAYRANALSCAKCGLSLPVATHALVGKDEMTVKGTAFLARRRTLDSTLGSAKIDALIRELATKYGVFSTPILASTKIPVTHWIAFNDTLIERFFGGTDRTYWRFGQESAEFALSGPYKNLVQNRDRAAYAQAVSTAWKVYYSHGRAEGAWVGDVFRYAIEDLPVHHVYFEYTACGWVEHGLQLIGAPVLRTKAVSGYSRGDSRVEYHFHCS
jgi:hypothetical protein